MSTTPEEIAEYWKNRRRKVFFDNLGWFSPYYGYWLHHDRVMKRYSLNRGTNHPHDPDGDFPMTIDVSYDLKDLVDKAKQYRILDLESELKELKLNDQYDFEGPL